MTKSNVSKIIKDGWEKLSRLDPINDSQVIFSDELIPNSMLLGCCNCDHWAVALPFTELAPYATIVVDKNKFPRDALFDSMLQYVRKALAPTP